MMLGKSTLSVEICFKHTIHEIVEKMNNEEARIVKKIQSIDKYFYYQSVNRLSANPM